LGAIPKTTTWSMSAPATTLTGISITGSSLALPISAVFDPGALPLPAIVSAKSIKTHTNVGDFGINLAVPGLQSDASECRLIDATHPMRIDVTFSTSITTADADHTFNTGAGQEVQLSSTAAGPITGSASLASPSVLQIVLTTI